MFNDFFRWLGVGLRAHANSDMFFRHSATGSFIREHL
jgi:hypothetical protein